MYAPPFLSTFTFSAVYSFLNALFIASITLSTASLYFVISPTVISFPSKYTTFAFPLYLNLNIPYPLLSVVYSKFSILLLPFKLFILFAIAVNPFVSVACPSLFNIYCLIVIPLYSISI